MLYLLAILCGLGAWICSILVGIQGLKRQQTVLGIICMIPFCVIVGVIVGWLKQKEWGLDKNLVLALTVLFVAAFVLQILYGVTAQPVVVVH